MTDDTAISFYDRWARLYDWLSTAPPIHGWRDRTVDSLDLTAGDTVVEMGCGTGANLSFLRERVGSTGRIVGVDFSGGVLARARSRVEREARESVHLVRADATRPPVAESVDAVLATFVVGMFDDPASAVERWCDLVAPGGRVALLNAQRSTAFPTKALNPAFGWLVGTVNPGPRAGAADRLERRVTTARDALAERTTDYRTETLAGGFLGLASGEVPT